MSDIKEIGAPVAWIGPHTGNKEKGDWRHLQLDYDATGGYGISADTAIAEGYAPLYAAPQPPSVSREVLKYALQERAWHDATDDVVEALRELGIEVTP